MKFSVTAQIKGRHNDADVQVAFECSAAEAVEIMTRDSHIIHDLAKMFSEFKKDELVECNRELANENEYLRHRVEELEDEYERQYELGKYKKSK